MKAQAIRVKQYGGPEVLEIGEVDVGDPGPDEIRIKQHAIGLNFIDIYYRTGLYQSPLPHGLGFEAAGVVEAVGSNVKFLKEGDRVAYGQSPLGAYANLRVMPAQMVVRLPAKISFEEGAAVMLKGLTVQYLFRQTYRLQGTETIRPLSNRSSRARGRRGTSIHRVDCARADDGVLGRQPAAGADDGRLRPRRRVPLRAAGDRVPDPDGARLGRARLRLERAASTAG